MHSRLLIQVDKGHGKHIVLLHGLGTNYKSWTFVLRRLDYTKSRVIALDLLGFGDSPKPKNCTYTPADHAKAVIAALDSLGVTHATLAGHSMGCIVAIEIAKLRPDLVRNLVLLGAPLYETPPTAGWRSKLKIPENAYFTIFSFIKDNPELTIAGAKTAEKTLPAVKGMEITEETWPAFKSSLKHTVMQCESYKDALHLNTPTLLVCGLLDVFVIRKNLKILAHKNKKFIRLKTVLGPHEITPLQGKAVARLLQKE